MTSSKITVLHSPAGTLHISKEGIRFLPPPEWLLELIELKESGVLNDRGCKYVFAKWRMGMLNQVPEFLERLTARLQTQPPEQSPETDPATGWN